MNPVQRTPAWAWVGIVGLVLLGVMGDRILHASSTPAEFVDDRGRCRNLTLVMTHGYHRAGGKEATSESIYYFSPHATCVFDYDPRQRAFFETAVNTLPPIVDYAMHGTPRFDYMLLLPDGQQAYAYGGGTNQLDVYRNMTVYAKPEVLLFTGTALRRQFEKAAETENMQVQVVDRPAGDPTSPSTGEYSFCREFRLCEPDASGSCAWRAAAYSQTGPEGPYDQIDFFQATGELHTRVRNSEFHEIDGVVLPQQVEVIRPNSDPEFYHIRETQVNANLDPRLFEPIAPNPGCVVLIHEKGQNGEVSTTRVDLPRTSDLNAISDDALSMTQTSNRPVIDRHAHAPASLESGTVRQNSGQNHEPTSAVFATGASPLWRLLLALVIVLACAGGILKGISRRGGKTHGK